MKDFAILQLRPETEASDSEYAAFLEKGALAPSRAKRFRLDQAPLPDDFNPADYAGIIVGGGPGCVSDAPQDKDPTEARIEAEVLRIMDPITAQDLPFMGCCYGMGILGAHLGAEVGKGRYGESVRATKCKLTGADDPLIDGLPPQFEAFVGHKEALHELPPGCTHMVGSDPCPFQMIRYGENVYATQFHPEADAHEFETRIRIYRNKGYFEPHEADGLIDMCHRADVHAPVEILKRFIARYG